LAEVWAVALFDLRVAEEEVGRLNLLEYSELLKRKQVEDDKARLNAGFVYAAVLNSAWGNPNRVAAQPTDIVASMQKAKEFDLRELTPEQQKAYLMSMFYGGNKTQYKEKA
jgi:hypothetical protein